MKRAARYIIAGCVLALMLAVLAVALGASAEKRSAAVCERLGVVIRDSLENSFVSAEDIREYLGKESGGYIGKRLDSLDLQKIEKIVDGRSAVLKSEAYVTKDGTLNISVTQRRPAVRFQKKDGGFYADKEGFLFPLQSSYTAYVPIIDGHIPLKADSGYKGAASDEKEQEWIDKILGLVRYMEDSGVWAEDIVQITVRQNGDLVMIPRKGKEKFIFGPPDGITGKFGRMEKYYTAIVPDKGEGYYSTVNVKYDGQIICRK